MVVDGGSQKGSVENNSNGFELCMIASFIYCSSIPFLLLMLTRNWLLTSCSISWYWLVTFYLFSVYVLFDPLLKK